MGVFFEVCFCFHFGFGGFFLGGGCQIYILSSHYFSLLFYLAVLQEVVPLGLKRWLNKEEVEMGGQGRARGFLSCFADAVLFSDPAGRGRVCPTGSHAAVQ